MFVMTISSVYNGGTERPDQLSVSIYTYHTGEFADGGWRPHRIQGFYAKSSIGLRRFEMKHLLVVPI